MNSSIPGIILISLFFCLSLWQEAKGAIILSPSFSLSEQYTDNLFFSDLDQKSDITSILSPSLSMAFTSKYASLTIGYQGSAQFHSNHPETDGYFQSLSFDIGLPVLNRQIRGLEIIVTENISYSPELPAFSFGTEETEADQSFDQVFLAGEGVQRSGRVDTFRNYAAISVSYPWSKNFVTTGTYANVITRYSDDTLEGTEVNNGTAEAQYRYPLSSRTEWDTVYGLAATFGEGFAVIHHLNTGISHRLTHLVSISTGFGISFPDGESPEANLEGKISKRHKTGTFNLRYKSQLVTGLGLIRGVTRRQSVISSANYVLAKKISSSLKLGYTSNRSFENNTIDVESYVADLGFSVNFLSWLQGKLNYSYLKQQSKSDLGEDGERNIVSFTLTASGAPWKITR